MTGLPGTRTTWIAPYEKREFEVEGRPAVIVCPERELAGRPWAWKGEFLNAFPGTELALLAEGFHIAYLGYPDRFGSPDAVARWNDLYEILTEDHGFARKAALLGLSRGALYCYQWAIANPEKVSCIYGDAPVCDMRSWPGGKGRGAGSPVDWMKVMETFRFATDAEAMEYAGNPVDNLSGLAENDVPILHVYGDADDVVPWEENTGVVADRYEKLDGDISLIAKPGCGHHPHGLADPTPVVEFVMKHSSDESA